MVCAREAAPFLGDCTRLESPTSVSIDIEKKFSAIDAPHPDGGVRRCGC